MSSPFDADVAQRPTAAPGADQRRHSTGSDGVGSLSAVGIALIVAEQCASRCLLHASSWLCELFLSCPPAIADQPVPHGTFQMLSEVPLPPAIQMRLTLGQALFGKGEFQRCQHVLAGGVSSSSSFAQPSPLPRGGRNCADPSPDERSSPMMDCHHHLANPCRRYPQLSFLAIYAAYMDGQRVRATSPGGNQPHKTSAAHNSHLRSLRTMLLGAVELFPSDPYISWLCGVVCRDLGLKQDAAVYLLSSVAMNPFFWSAWEDLAALINRVSQLDEILAKLKVLQVPLILDIFAATVKADLHLSVEACATWEQLHLQVPDSNFIKTQAATALYDHKDFDVAKSLYEAVRLSDPYRLDGMDDYSNTLFVLGDRLALSVLAHDVARIDAYRPESNCVMGNYYAIVQRHDKALVHFRRAVAIDPSYLSAWTLMGHSYLEVKNTSAAVQAYRTAVDLDMRDYRAWYGLGQIYELLQMYHYALYYYWQTTSVRATDPRMWTAVANCLDKQNRAAEAVLCLQRAEEYESPSAEGYATIVRRIVESMVRPATATAGSSSSASPPTSSNFLAGASQDEAVVHYLNKMIGASTGSPGVHSAWVRRDDVAFALPLLIESHLRIANDVLMVPARSASCDVGVAAAAANSGAPRPSADLRKSTGAASIAAAEAYLGLLPIYDVKLSTRQILADLQTAKVFLAALK